MRLIRNLMYVILTNNNDMLFFNEMLALYDNLHFYFDKDSCLVFVIQNIFEKRTNKSYQKIKRKLFRQSICLHLKRCNLQSCLFIFVYWTYILIKSFWLLTLSWRRPLSYRNQSIKNHSCLDFALQPFRIY